MQARWDIVNELLTTTKQQRFLEIGIQHGECGARVRATSKIGVDPAPSGRATQHYSQIAAVPSDAFFAGLPSSERFDVVFIDGLHHADQVLRDVENALLHLADGGVIALHDCNPQSEIAQRVPRDAKVWNGDCWKAIAWLRQRRDLDVFTIDTDQGIGIVRRRPGATPLLDYNHGDLTYAVLEAARTELLGLVPQATWQERFGAPLALGRVVVLSAIFGGRDVPRPAPRIDVDEFLLYTDNPAPVPGWTLVRQSPSGGPRASARGIKALALQVTGADVVVWVDGRITVRDVPMRPLLRAALQDADVAGFPHPWRSCAYDEAMECAKLGLVPATALDAQTASYRAVGFPANAGLWNTMVLARRNTARTRELGRAWLAEMQRFTIRDQVSFPFLLWSMQIQCAKLGDDVHRARSSPNFARGEHVGVPTREERVAAARAPQVARAPAGPVRRTRRGARRKVRP